MIDPGTATLIGTGLNIAGGLFSQSSARGAYQHRYQDTVADMRKAGLNPALAYGQNPGGGAQTADFGDVGSQAASAAQAAAQAAKTRAETSLLQAQREELINQVRIRNFLLQRQTEQASSATDVNTLRAGLLSLDNERYKRTFQSDVDAQLAANLQTTLGTPEARARAKYYHQMGAGAFYFNNALDAAKVGAQLYGARGLNKPRLNVYPRR